MKGSVLSGLPGPVLFEYQPKKTKIESSDGGSHHQSPMKWGSAKDYLCAVLLVIYLFGFGAIVYFHMLIWDVPLPYLSCVLPCAASWWCIPWYASHPSWLLLGCKSFLLPQRHLCQQSKSWHTSALSSPTSPALALPAQGAQKSRSLRPVELSLYVHCTATLRCDFSSSHTASFPTPFCLLCSHSPTSPYQPKKPKALPAVGVLLPCRASCWLPWAQMKPVCEGELKRALT